MGDLSAAELLEVWERSSARSPTERALAVLSAANRSIESEALAAMSIGRRDELLLSVRKSVFGPQLMAIVDCPECRQQLEFSVNVDELRISNSEIGPPAPMALAVDGYEISFRLPDSRDLIAAGAAGNIESARKTLLERCLLAARNDSSEVPTDRLPKEIIETVEQEMSRRDAQANVQLELTCPSCRREWNAAFDILSFFWSELDAWAQRLLVEVHKLASAYGWREGDILEMGAVRRNIYLNMVSG
jgi:uncharacterized protein YbaR (Trm112 family)